MRRRFVLGTRPYFILLSALVLCVAHAESPGKALTTAYVMEELAVSGWRQPDPANLLVMDLDNGEVIFELAPGFAPHTVSNIKTLVHEGYFDGLAIIRAHDNYVAQWGVPAVDEDKLRSLGTAAESIAPEFDRAAENLEMIEIKSRDAYSDTVGFVDGFRPAVMANEPGRPTVTAHSPPRAACRPRVAMARACAS